MNVVFLYADRQKEWNSSHWRSYLPSTFLRRFENCETEMMPIDDLLNPQTIPVLEKADIIYIERLVSNQIYTSLEYWRLRGKKIIFDMDDSYKNIPPGFGAYDFWINGVMGKGETRFTIPYAPIEQLDWYTKLMDAISSPSKLILDDWKEFNENRLWIPNFIDQDLYQQIPKREGKITIGWGGGANHFPCWYDSGLLTAFRRVYVKYKSRIQLMIVSRDEFLAYKLREFKPIVVKADRLTYPGEMFKFDIGLAPGAGQYDRRRSWLKIAEYSASAIPWLASELDPYKEHKINGSMLVENKPREWEEALSEMIENYPAHRATMKKHYPDAMKMFSIQENHKFLFDQFHSVLEQ